MAVTGKLACAGQLANVSAVLIVAPRAGANSEVLRTAKLLARLFEDVVIVGADSELREFGRTVARSETCDIVAGLEAAREDRVLVVAVNERAQSISAELLLGLSAWPEHECVAPTIDGRVMPQCVLIDRLAGLRIARERKLPVADPFDAILARLDSSEITSLDLAALLGPSATIS